MEAAQHLGKPVAHCALTPRSLRNGTSSFQIIAHRQRLDCATVTSITHFVWLSGRSSILSISNEEHSLPRLLNCRKTGTSSQTSNALAPSRPSSAGPASPSARSPLSFTSASPCFGICCRQASRDVRARSRSRDSHSNRSHLRLGSSDPTVRACPQDDSSMKCGGNFAT